MGTTAVERESVTEEVQSVGRCFMNSSPRKEPCAHTFLATRCSAETSPLGNQDSIPVETEIVGRNKSVADVVAQAAVTVVRRDAVLGKKLASVSMDSECFQGNGDIVVDENLKRIAVRFEPRLR